MKKKVNSLEVNIYKIQKMLKQILDHLWQSNNNQILPNEVQIINKNEEKEQGKPECNCSYFCGQSLSNEYIQSWVNSSQIVTSETEKPSMILSKAQKKKLRTKNKKIEDHTQEDQILRSIFAE